MTSHAEQSRLWLARLRSAASAVARPVAFMEVCGTHTVSAFRCGLPSLLPPNVRLISGPGCPVCVTSQGDIDQLLDLAARPRVTLCTYGDMLRVTGSDRRSLEAARAAGADVRVVYSALDALRVAAQSPQRQVVLAAVGFETTTPATAVAVLEAERQALANFTVFVSHKQVIPAMRALLDGGEVAIDGFLCPGHVSVIIGADAYQRIVADYRIPCVVVGFEDCQIVEGVAALTALVASGTAKLVNLYPEAVGHHGNSRAVRLMEQVFETCDETWRGLSRLPASGRRLRDAYAAFDARRRFGLHPVDVPDPPGCRCGDVITGRCAPDACRLFGTGCTPVHPIGPCMVSSEGTCQAHFKYARRRPAVTVMVPAANDTHDVEVTP